MKMIKKFLCTFLVLILLAAAVPTAHAADYTIQNVRISADGIITWDAFEGADQYWLNYGKGGGWVSGGKTTANLYRLCTAMGLDSGNVKIKLKAFNGTNNISETWEGFYYFNAPPRLETPKNLHWVGYNAVWDPVPHAKTYTISLYRNNSIINSKRLVRTTHFDMTDWLANVGTYEYYFEIIASADDYRTNEDKAFSEKVTLTYPDPSVKKYIFDVAATVTEPAEGEQPVYNAEVAENVDYELSEYAFGNTFSNGVGWRCNDAWIDYDSFDGFEVGSTYMVQVILEVTDPGACRFADSTDLTATINGYPAIVTPMSGTQVALSFSFTVTEVIDPYAISEIALDLTTAGAGQKPPYAASASGSATYRVESEYSDDDGYRNGVCWMMGNAVLDPDTATFQAGKTYTAVISVVPKDDYHFSDGVIEATVNGQAAEAVLIGSYVLVDCDFTIPGSSGGYFVGDVNLDKTVNNRDAVILDRYIAGWTGYDKEIKDMNLADIDRNSEVTNRDAVLLDRYIAGWTGYDAYIIKV